MELNHLKYFYIVARESSFTRASRVLRVQQPTISKMVRHLEDELGLTLIERNKKGIRLTKSGGEIYRTCEEIFDKVESIHSLLDREKKECYGPVSLGATDSVASYLIPKVMRAFVDENPNVIPSIFAGSSNLICSEILEGRIEFGLCFTVPDRDGFEVKEILRVPFQLVIATSQIKNPEVWHRFVISREVDYSKYKPFPVLDMLRRQQVKVTPAITSNNLDLQKEMVMEGLGVALLPRFMVKSGLARGNLSALHPKKDFSYSLKTVTRKGKVLSRNSATFLESFAKLAPQLI